MGETATALFSPESRIMRLLQRLGFESLVWSFRRLYCPVGEEALVLEVGSGGNPYPRANVLLDAHEETRQRHYAPLKVDRPFVFGLIERLPFKTGAFDFLIASHVLEHSTNPEKALAEFQRVARAGYIEVPDAFFERINPYRDHHSEITLRQDELLIWKKTEWVVDKEIVELYEERVKPFLTRKIIPQHPFMFHVRHYWTGRINYKVVNPKADATWMPTEEGPPWVYQPGFKMRVRIAFLDIITRQLSQRRRNRNIDLFSLLSCPACGSEEIYRNKSLNNLECKRCKSTYPIRRSIPVMYPKLSSGFCHEQAALGH